MVAGLIVSRCYRTTGSSRASGRHQNGEYPLSADTIGGLPEDDVCGLVRDHDS
jgi:hypothetical protein